MKQIKILYVVIFLFSIELFATDLYKSVQEVVQKESPSQDVDSDGILDYLDDCPDSYLDTQVNKYGCPITVFIALLPNAKKHNSILVENEIGEVEVNEVYTFVNISSEEEPPEPQKTSKAEIEKMFPFMADNRYKKAKRYTLYFQGTNLQASSKRRMQTIYLDIRSRTNPSIEIVGYTDSMGSKSKNLILGEKRAQKLKALLDKEQLQYLKISLSSMGEANQKIKTRDGVNEPRNRRAEILIK